MTLFAPVTESAAQTRAIAAALGAVVRAGDLVLLSGPLGAGKTEFAKGFAAGLGVPPDEIVVSPTFVLTRQYGGRLRLQHSDLYRLASAEEVLDLGICDAADGADDVRLVEWADRFPAVWPRDRIEVSLAYVDGAPDSRAITIRVTDNSLAAAFATRTRETGIDLEQRRAHDHSG